MAPKQQTKSPARTTGTAEPARRYTNTRRAAQAAQTRAEVLGAAIALFGASGWAGTTIADIAERAGVAVETVYSGFKSKKALLRAALDVSIVGDAEPIPYIDRVEVQALAKGPPAARMKAGIALLTTVHERSAGVWRAVIEASAGDPEIEAWRRQWEDNRKLDTRRSLEMIFEHEIDELLLDLVWALYSPEIYLKLTVEAGWTREMYEEHILDASKRLVLRR
jgi:AcrR family transcriptional regulator